jgi:hypothetical protein
MGRKSQITGMLLSNYILSINLMKSIANKFTSPDTFEESHTSQLNSLKLVEQTIDSQNQNSQRESTTVAISYLVT